MKLILSKEARSLLIEAGFNSKENPAIAALVAFAAQEPGLDPADYGGNNRALQEELQSIRSDWDRFVTGLHEAGADGVTDAHVLAEAKRRLTAKMEDGQFVRWEYCTGQYFPTEYRKAAASLIEDAASAVRRARPPVKQMPRTIDELKALNKKNGGHWFDRGSMAFFGTRIESKILFGCYFITSEQPPHGDRKFSLRTFDDEGGVETVGDFCSYPRKGDASRAARKIALAKLSTPAE